MHARRAVQIGRSRPCPINTAHLTLSIGELRQAGLVRALTPAALFELGNLATTLLIFRATNLLAGFLLARLGMGSAETAESTVVAQLLPERLRSNGFGILGLVQSFGDLGATLTAGILWAVISPTVAFLYAATWMALSLAAACWLRPRPHTIPKKG